MADPRCLLVVAPVVAMWEAAGRPEPDWQGKAREDRPTPVAFDGTCAVTGTGGEIWPAAAVVSENFADWDRCPGRHLRPCGFSTPVAWALRNRDLVLRSHILADGRLTCAQPADLFTALSASLAPVCAVTVPIGRQKHVAPWAQWGLVSTDNRALRWRQIDAQRLVMLAWLRSAGFGERAVTAASPPWPLLKRLTSVDRDRAIDYWAALRGWREDQLYLTVGCLATRRDKDKEIADGDCD